MEKKIIFSIHARPKVSSRGFTVDEVEETIRTAVWQEARDGRRECRKTYPYNGEWNGIMYANKIVEPVFVDEPAAITVVTVYTYFEKSRKAS